MSETIPEYGHANKKKNQPGLFSNTYVKIVLYFIPFIVLFGFYSNTLGSLDATKLETRLLHEILCADKEDFKQRLKTIPPPSEGSKHQLIKVNNKDGTAASEASFWKYIKASTLEKCDDLDKW